MFRKGSRSRGGLAAAPPPPPLPMRARALGQVESISEGDDPSTTSQPLPQSAAEHTITGDQELMRRVEELEAENGRLRACPNDDIGLLRLELEQTKRKLAEAEEETFSLSAQLATNEAEKGYEIEKGLERLTAELRFKNEEVAQAQRSLRRQRTVKKAGESEQAARSVLDAVFCLHSDDTWPIETRAAVSTLGRATSPEQVFSAARACALAAVRDNCVELAHDIVSSLLPIEEPNTPWAESAFTLAFDKLEQLNNLDHLPIAVALSRLASLEASTKLLLCSPRRSRDSLCADLLIRGKPLHADCIADLLRCAAETHALDIIETKLFPQLAKALAFSSSAPRNSSHSRRIVRTAILVSSTLARREPDLTLRLLAGPPFRTLLQDANDLLEVDRLMSRFNDVAPILHLLAHLLFYSTHPSPLKALLHGIEDDSKLRRHPSNVLARHELQALLDSLKYLRPNKLPLHQVRALDRDLDTVHLHFAQLYPPPASSAPCPALFA